MDITKLLQSLEEFVYDVACLAVLVPKTFFLLTFFPRRVFQYVTTELQKPADERFDRYTSPLIQWLLTGLMPHFITLSIFASLPTLRALLPANNHVSDILRLSMESRFTALSAFAVSLPVALAVVTVRERRQEVTKAALRAPLYMQCYCLCPQLMAAIPLWYFWEAKQRGVHEHITQYTQFYGTLVAIWFIYTSLVLFRLQLSVSWKRAFWLLAKSYFVFLGIVCVLEICILMVVHFAGEPGV
jgi:hypothetical protein